MESVHWRFEDVKVILEFGLNHAQHLRSPVPVGVENTIRRLRVVRHGSFSELIVFEWGLTDVHHDGVELE
jgi:hypothetical protein